MPIFTLPKNDSRDEIVVKTEKKLGSGSYGIVYEILFNSIPSALKIVKKDKSDDGIREEIELIQYLIKNYPDCNVDNILCYTDISEDDENIYFVSDLMKMDLEKFIRSSEYKKLPFSKKINIIWDITNQTIRGIDALHKIGVIHRDIKLPNILINKKGNKYTVKISDFGLSCIIQRCDGFSGTPINLPPDITFGKNIKWTPEADLYSFGVALYRLLTHKYLNTAQNLIEYENRNLSGKELLDEYMKVYDRKMNSLNNIRDKLSKSRSSVKSKYDKLVSVVKELTYPKYKKKITATDVIKMLK